METSKISIGAKVKKEYSSLYCLKALGVLFVLMIHFHCYKSQYFEPLYRCGVPLFFIISGFFLYDNNANRLKQSITKGIKKIIKLIIFFNVVYYMLFCLTDGNSKIQGITDIILLLIYGDVISGHLWFLTSYLWTLVFFYIYKSLIEKDNSLYIIAFCYLILGLIENQYSKLLGIEGFSIKNYYMPWLTSSLPMMTIGYVCKKYEVEILNWYKSTRKSVLLLISALCIIMPYVEHHLLSKLDAYQGNFMVTTFFATIVMFIFCVCNSNDGKHTVMETIGKEHSGNIYYWQFAPYYLFVCPLLSEQLLAIIGLPLMILILLLWSYGANNVRYLLKF